MPEVRLAPHGVGGAKCIAPPAPEIAITAGSANSDTTPGSRPRRPRRGGPWAQRKPEEPRFQRRFNSRRRLPKGKKGGAAALLSPKARPSGARPGQARAPRRTGSRFNVAALPETLTPRKSSGLPFLASLRLKQRSQEQPMKNKSPATTSRTFSTKVVPKVHRCGKSRRRGQPCPGGQPSSSASLGATVGEVPEERKILDPRRLCVLLQPDRCY